MPWNLEITQLDVGQGDSSLIIASHSDGRVRSMLVDGGLIGYTNVVHRYVTSRLNAVNANGLDHVVVSHFDDDHVSGVRGLLEADNFSAICECLATAATTAFAAAAGKSDARRTAAAAAAAAAAAWGAYAGVGFADHSATAVQAGAKASELALPDSNTPVQNAQAGAALGRQQAREALAANPPLIKSSQSVGTAGTAAGYGAFTGKDNAPERQLWFTQKMIADRIAGALDGAFLTGGVYRRTQVIDGGNIIGLPDKWGEIVDGSVLMWKDLFAKPPGPQRIRSSITPQVLGAEILWKSGPNPVPAPAGAPAVFLVTGLGYVWGRQTGYPPIGGNNPNDLAIGLIVRFGNFFYFTAGDLPSVGEELAVARVKSTGFPDPQGGNNFPPATRFAAFKVGHHGSDGSTSDAYLKAANAEAALISCGKNTFGKDSDKHPTQNVIDRINARLPRFYLTNCKYETNHVPASLGSHFQLAEIGNRSRVCGDNANDNLAAHRYRGDAMIRISEAESTGTGATQQFHLQYWDNDDIAHQPGRRVGIYVETRPF